MKHIAITGDLGSGKSTAAKALCKKLGYGYLSTGGIQRAMAAQLGMTTLEMNYRALTDKSIDEKIDNYLIAINTQSEPHLLDSRLAWHFVPNSFKVFATVQPIVAARRVQGDASRTSEGEAENSVQKSKELIERQQVENNRFKDKYQVDCRNLDNYDLVIDTSFHTVEEITTFINESYELFCRKIERQKCWASPKLFLPAQSFNAALLDTPSEHCSPLEVCENHHHLVVSRGHATLAEALSSNAFIPYKIVSGNLSPCASVLASWENQFGWPYAAIE